MSDERRRLPDINTVYTAGPVKTVLIWVVLIGMWIAIYSMFSDHPRPITIGGIVAGIVLVLALVVALNYRSIKRTNRRYVADINEASAALGRGELSRARDVYWHWAERATAPRGAALARHNLAWTLMRQGELEHAVDVFTDYEQRHEAPLKQIGMHGVSAADFALAHALLGNTKDAEPWLMAAEKRAEDPPLPMARALIVLARAVIDCRAGRVADASRLLQERWAECEAHLVGSTLRLVRVVRAFAQAAEGPRNAGVVDATLANMRPQYPGEFEFLGAAWPEMHAFLVTHQLASAPTA